MSPFNMNPFREREMPRNENWLSQVKKEISESYIKYKEPWKQAGFLMGQEEWDICHKPIAECIEKPGLFLDIGCTNGYLLECILKWTSDGITPYGIDLSARLIKVAKERSPKFESNLYVGNVPGWASPTKFDYVRTELDGVLEESQEQYLHKVLNTYVVQGGKLLLTEYRTKKDPPGKPWINDKVNKWGMYIADQKSAFIEGKELTRVLVFANIMTT
jgi:SAM-dependent methyltransferase